MVTLNTQCDIPLNILCGILFSMRKRNVEERILMKVPKSFKKKIDEKSDELGITSTHYLEDVEITRVEKII